MKNVYRLGLPGILLTSLALPVCADPSWDNYNDQISNNTGQISASTQQTSDNTKQIATYLLNFGTYLGFDLSQSPKNPVAPLLNLTSSLLFSVSPDSSGSGTGGATMPLFSTIFDTFLGALPVNAAASQFVPDNNPNAPTLNAFANSTFPSYNNASSGQSNTISVSTGIDQLSYQQDPVSQAVLNILTTPDISYCMDNSGSSWTGGAILMGSTNSGGAQTYPNCKYTYGNKVISNIIGDLPTPYSFFSYDYNQHFLSQLNINTLITPLLYTTTSSTTSSTSSPTPASQQQNNGSLPAQTQAQLASDFIRYASGAVAPISLPKQNVYNMLYAQATNSSNNIPLTQQIASQAVLNNYFAKLRAYAAVISVPYSNLYYIFSKRMPQSTGGGAGTPATSQALNEFTMSTWRLYTPQGQANAQWLNQLNTASSATVQKEIATLLAEINYQLYLTRQQEERILLTNTMLLLLGSHSTQPLAPSMDSLNTTGSSSQINNQ